MKKSIIFICVFLLLLISASTIFADDILISRNELTDIKNSSDLIKIFGTSNTTIIEKELFTVLKMNNGTSKEAIFNLNGVKLPETSNLSLTFVEMCGKVESYDIVLPRTCSNITSICSLDNASKSTCNDINYTYSCDIPITNISYKSQDYKITNVKIKEDWCLINDTYYTYLIDWRPKLEINNNTIVYNEWEIWEGIGGTITTSGQYKIHTYRTDGAFNSTGILNLTIMVIAGGGGGGASQGGGGGAGGYQFNISQMVPPGNYTIKVGAGGAGGGTSGPGANGTNSSFYNYTAMGGGGGAFVTKQNGSFGGSGGGGSSGAVIGKGGRGYQGTNGSIAVTLNANNGGGGGCGGAITTFYNQSNGTDGTNNSINGSNIYYCGGGAGYGSAIPGYGGIGGGGNASTSGEANTGGGGGGWNGTGVAGAGGTGIVIIRYIIPTYTIKGIVKYGTTPLPNVNVSIYNINDFSLFASTITNSTGGYNITGVTNNTNYIVLASLFNTTVNYTKSDKVFVSTVD